MEINKWIMEKGMNKTVIAKTLTTKFSVNYM